jgi:hypothetical protein
MWRNNSDRPLFASIEFYWILLELARGWNSHVVHVVSSRKLGTAPMPAAARSKAKAQNIMAKANLVSQTGSAAALRQSHLIDKPLSPKTQFSYQILPGAGPTNWLWPGVMSTKLHDSLIWKSLKQNKHHFDQISSTWKINFPGKSLGVWIPYILLFCLIPGPIPLQPKIKAVKAQCFPAAARRWVGM